MSRLRSKVAVLLLSMVLPAAASAQGGETDARPPASSGAGQPRGSRHVVALLQPTLPALWSCLAQGLAQGEEGPPEVLARLEFPAGRAPSVVAVDAWPGSAVDRCVRQALAPVRVPAFAGPPERHECLIPLDADGLLRCRPAQPSGTSAPAPGPAPQPVPSAPPPSPPLPPSPPSPPSSTARAASSPAPGEARPEPGQGQTEGAAAPRRNSITVNPLGVVVGGFDLKYTRALEHLSVGVALVIQVPARLDDLGLLGLVEVLGWPGERSSDGFFAGVALQAGSRFTPDVVMVGPLAVVGYRWLLRSGFTLGVSSALGYTFFFSQACTSGCSLRTVGRQTELDGDGRGGALAVRLSFDVGFAF